MVLSWLLNSLTKEIVASVISTSIAKEVWRNLKTEFAQENGPNLFLLKKGLASLTQEKYSISVYYTKLRDEFYTVRPILRCTRNSRCSYGALKMLIDQHEQ